MMNNQKGNVLLIVVLVFTALAGFLIYIKNTLITDEPFPSGPSETPSNETANWKTYENPELGISLKYDPYYIPVERFHTLKSGESIFILTSQNNFDSSSISICKTFKEKLCLIPGQNWNQEKDIKQITLSGKDAISFFVGTLNQDGEVQNVLHVIQLKGNHPIEMALTVDGMGGEEVFQKILSTFKFTQ